MTIIIIIIIIIIFFFLSKSYGFLPQPSNNIEDLIWLQVAQLPYLKTLPPKKHTHPPRFLSAYIYTTVKRALDLYTPHPGFQYTTRSLPFLLANPKKKTFICDDGILAPRGVDPIYGKISGNFSSSSPQANIFVGVGLLGRLGPTSGKKTFKTNPCDFFIGPVR